MKKKREEENGNVFCCLLTEELTHAHPIHIQNMSRFTLVLRDHNAYPNRSNKTEKKRTELGLTKVEMLQKDKENCTLKMSWVRGRGWEKVDSIIFMFRKSKKLMIVFRIYVYTISMSIRNERDEIIIRFEFPKKITWLSFDQTKERERLRQRFF